MLQITIYLKSGAHFEFFAQKFTVNKSASNDETTGLRWSFPDNPELTTMLDVDMTQVAAVLSRRVQDLTATSGDAAGGLASIDDAGDDGPADSQATCFRCGLRYEDCDCEPGRHSGFGSSEEL